MTPLESYCAPASRRPGAWRVALGVIFIAVSWILGSILVMGGWLALRIFETGGLTGDLDFNRLIEGGGPGLILALLLSFAMIWPGVMITGMIFHNQPFKTFFAPDGSRALPDFLRGAALGIVLVTLALGGAFLVTPEINPGIAPADWAIYAVPVILLVFVQATGEELIFRGYLLQQLAIRVRSPIVWAGIPSLLFGLLHVSNAGGAGGEPVVTLAGVPLLEAQLYYMGITFLMGLTLAALVWRSGSLWQAIGVHVANNVLGFLLIAPDGPFAGTQLYLVDKSAVLPILQVDLVILVGLFLFVISPLGRVFGDGRRDVTAA